ncbi:lipoyl(octanoyl) transferase LipB [Quadrisphaera sp. KR29]|uniref:lipoyl(octanoyl) transferase LipB n=1 Tax=Quadrisphaera sp. KR29 TaxID=3461391 RepID=UPI00404504EC
MQQGPSVERVGGVGAGGLVDYLEAWELQRRVHADVVAGRRGDALLLLEHPPVFTAGKLTEPADRPLAGSGVPVVDVDRGGRITWHGPGQLVGYPVLSLAGRIDVVKHVRRVEELLIAVCADLGVSAERVRGRSGVWVAERKVAAIGIRVAQSVTMHGFALNCDNDLGAYGAIVPCGIADAGVTTLSAELGRQVTVAEVLPLVEARAALLDPAREPAAA